MTEMSRFAPLDAQVLARGRNGAGERNRTPDRLITNQLLYLLSYASFTRYARNTVCRAVEGANDPLRASDRQAVESS